MNYRCEPVEMTVRRMETPDASATWLISLCREYQNGEMRYVGTVWSCATNRPLAVGKHGERRRVMRSEVEGTLWYRSVALGSGVCS